MHGQLEEGGTKQRRDGRKGGVEEKQSLTGNNFVNFVEPAKEGRKERI